MGDSSMDPRRNEEDIYFILLLLTENFTNIMNIFQNLFRRTLYPSKKRKLNVYVDHFKAQSENEREVSINTINKIFEDIRNSKYRLMCSTTRLKVLKKTDYTLKFQIKDTSDC